METTDLPLAQRTGPWTRTLRLTFSSEGEQVRLVSRQSIDMIPPGSGTTPPQPGQTGYWCELRDDSDRVLYAIPLHNPLRSVVEAHSNDPRPAIHTREVAHPRGTFVVLVPEIPEARTIVLFGSPCRRGETHRAAKEIARFSLAHGSGEGSDQP
jgi:hypothetical protein